MSTPQFVPIPLIHPNYQDQALQLIEQDAGARALAEAGADLLCSFFPDRVPLIERFKDAFVSWICCGTDRQLAHLQKMTAAVRSYEPPSEEEQLIRLIEERDRAMEKLEEIEASFSDHGKSRVPPELLAPMKLALLSMVQPNLDTIDLQISALQSQIERKNSVVNSFTEDAGGASMPSQTKPPAAS